MNCKHCVTKNYGTTVDYSLFFWNRTCFKRNTERNWVKHQKYDGNNSNIKY